MGESDLNKINQQWHLYLVSSPLQLLNAIEAQQRFALDSQNILIVFWKKPIERQQMTSLLNLSHWDSIEYFKINGLFRRFYPWVLSQLLKKYPRINTIYVGYPYNFRSYLINKAAPQRVVILDDGTASYAVARHLTASFDHPAKKRNQLTIAPELISFFSVYHDLPWPPEQYIANDYRCLKQQINYQGIDKNTVLFIGTPLHLECLPMRTFKQFLNVAIKRYKYQQITYVLHRFENQDLLTDLLDEDNKVRVNFVRFEQPLEITLMQLPTLPSKCVSFMSSAIYNLTFLFPIGYEILKIPMQEFYQEKKSTIVQVYNGFAKNPAITIDEIA